MSPAYKRAKANHKEDVKGDSLTTFSNTWRPMLLCQKGTTFALLFSSTLDPKSRDFGPQLRERMWCPWVPTTTNTTGISATRVIALMIVQYLRGISKPWFRRGFWRISWPSESVAPTLVLESVGRRLESKKWVRRPLGPKRRPWTWSVVASPLEEKRVALERSMRTKSLSLLRLGSAHERRMRWSSPFQSLR